MVAGTRMKYSSFSGLTPTHSSELNLNMASSGSLLGTLWTRSSIPAPCSQSTLPFFFGHTCRTCKYLSNVCLSLQRTVSVHECWESCMNNVVPDIHRCSTDHHWMEGVEGVDKWMDDLKILMATEGRYYIWGSKQEFERERKHVKNNSISSYWNFWEFDFILLCETHICFLKGNRDLQCRNFITAELSIRKCICWLLADSKFHGYFQLIIYFKNY